MFGGIVQHPSASPLLLVAGQCLETLAVQARGETATSIEATGDLMSCNLCPAAALFPRTLLAVGTKLSDRDVHALMAHAGRRLQSIHLGTSVIESMYCLR